MEAFSADKCLGLCECFPFLGAEFVCSFGKIVLRLGLMCFCLNWLRAFDAWDIFADPASRVELIFFAGCSAMLV